MKKNLSIMLYLSFDVATKSMGVSLIEYDLSWDKKIKDIINESTVDVNQYSAIEYIKYFLQVLDKIDKILNNVYKPILLDVVDLIPKKKVKGTSPVLISRRLNGYLHGLTSYINTENLTVLLEYQMGPNDKSRGICSQIIYHFASTDHNYNNIVELPHTNKQTTKIKIVGASLKNKITFDKPHSYFVGKYAKMYTANKKHSIHNFLYWVNLCGHIHLIKNIKKKNYDDIADAVIMTIAWIKKNE